MSVDATVAQYRRDTVARIPAAVTYAGAAGGCVACAGPPGRHQLSSRFDLRPESGPAVAFTARVQGGLAGRPG